MDVGRDHAGDRVIGQWAGYGKMNDRMVKRGGRRASKRKCGVER
jgi:hypothetical protein